MIPSPLSSGNWQDERRLWSNLYEVQLQERFRLASSFVQANAWRSDQLQSHFDSLLTLLRRARTRPALHSAAIDLVDRLHPWPMRWGRAGSWEQEIRFAEQISLAPEYASRRARFLVCLADLLLNISRLEEAFEINRQAMERAWEYQDIHTYVKAGSTHFSILMSLGRPGEAESLLEQIRIRVAKLAFISKNEKFIALVPITLCKMDFRRRAGHITAALEVGDQLVSGLEQETSVDPFIMAHAYNDRGLVRWAHGDYALAAHDLEHAAAMYAQQGDLLDLASAQANLGLVYWKMARFDLAETTLRKAIETEENIHAWWSLIRAMGNLGIVLFARGKLAEAGACFERQLNLADNLGNHAQAILARNNLAAIKLYQGKFTQAKDELELVMEGMREAGNQELQIGAMVDLSICCAGMGDKRRARQLMETAYQIIMEREADLERLKVIVLRCIALSAEPTEAITALQQSLALAQKYQLIMDEAGALFALVALVQDEQQKSAYWEQGVHLLKKMGATAWLEGHSKEHPPLLLFSA